MILRIKTDFISLNSIYQLIFVMEMHCVFFAVRTELLFWQASLRMVKVIDVEDLRKLGINCKQERLEKNIWRAVVEKAKFQTELCSPGRHKLCKNVGSRREINSQVLTR
jgi:hypothetical protein